MMSSSGCIFHNLEVSAMTEVRGKTVVITGAAMGMGRRLAETMAADGANLVLWDMNADKLAEAKEALAKLGGKVWTYVVDVTDRAQVYETAAKVRQDAGRIDVLVNNAGIVRGGAFLDVSDDDHVKTMQVNIISYFYVTRAFLPDMIARNEGHLVNIASAAGLLGVPGVTTYSASKFAVVGFTEALTTEMKKLGHNGVHFTTVCPSFVATGMFEGIKAPFLTPLLTTEDMVARIYKGIRKNQELVLAPFMVKTIGLLKAFNWPPIVRLIAGLFGMHESMDTWTGHPKVS
jgi:all-trans-retinol dehydrogenase (NAD+)